MTKYENLKRHIHDMLIGGLKPREIQKKLGISKSLYYYHVNQMDLVLVKKNDLRKVLKFFLDNAEFLPVLTPELEEAFNRLDRACGGVE